MIIKNNIKYFALFILFVCSCLAVQAQGTLDKLKFEEAEQKYLNKDYGGAITLLEELEQKGLKNPRTLHLKIMAVSKHHAPGYDIVVQFKKDVDYYLKNYDIEGLEDKYKEVYEVSKTLSAPKYDEASLCIKQGDTYYKAKLYENALEWYLKAGNYAEYINPKLFNRIGEMYFVGQGVEKDYKKAFDWFTKSATQGNAIGQANLGNMYHNGLGVEKDFTKAIEWYEKAANQGDAYSQNRLGIMYSQGLGAEKDINKAIEWYTKAGERGIVVGLYRDNGNFEKAITLNQRIIDDPKASEKEKGKAIRDMWFIHYSAGNYHEAIKQLERKDYLTGISTPLDYYEEYRKRNLALCYEGIGEYEKAYAYYSNFNERKEQISFDLGFYHYEGKQVDQSYEKAYELWGDGSVPCSHILKAIVLYTTRKQKLWGDNQVEMAVNLVKEGIGKIEKMKSFNNIPTIKSKLKIFPIFNKDKQEFFEYLEKKHNIIFEE